MIKKETLEQLLSILTSLEEKPTKLTSWEFEVIHKAVAGLEDITNYYFWKEQGYDLVPYQSKDQTFFRVECPGLYDIAYLNYWTTQKVPNSVKQPENNRWIFRLSFSTGAYIFGDDYDSELFDDFFEELKKFNPDFVDNINESLYWYIENAKNIAPKVSALFKKYSVIHQERLKTAKIAEMEKELAKLKGNK